MHVVDFLNIFDFQNGASDVFDSQIERAAFQKNVRRLAKDSDAGPKHEKANRKAEKRVNPMGAGGVNDQSARDDGYIGERIAKIVDENAAKIEVAAPADESESDAAIDGERAHRSPDHPAFDDFDGRAEAFERFIAKPERKQNKDEGVGESRKGSGAVIAIGFFAVGRALGPAHGEIGNPESGDIREIVHRVVQQGDAAAKDSAENFGDDQTESGDHGPAEYGGAKGRMNVASMTVGVDM